MRYAEVFMNHFALNGVISPQELYYYALRAVAMLIVIPFMNLPTRLSAGNWAIPPPRIWAACP